MERAAAPALASAFLGGATAVLLKKGTQGGDPFLVNAVKVAVGCLALGALVASSPEASFTLASPLDYALAAYLGFTGPFLAWYLYAKAISSGNVGAVTTVANTYPLTALALAYAVAGEPLSAVHAVGAVLVVGGLWLLTGGGTGEARPLAMAGLTSILWGVNQVVAKAVVAGNSPLTASFYRALFATVFAVPLALKREGSLPFRNAVFAAAAGLASDFAGIVLWMTALRLGEVAVAATISATSPLFATALSYAVLGEKMEKRRAVGVALAVAGVALVSSA